MARKSNKTAHVLNLLAGQDTTDEAESEKAKENKDADAQPAAPAPAQTAKAPSQTQTAQDPAQTAKASAEPAKTLTGPAAAAQPDMPSNISIIDKGAESDPVAERIRDELLKELDRELEDVADVPETTQTTEPISEPIVQTVNEPVVTPATVDIPLQTSIPRTPETASETAAPQIPETAASQATVTPSTPSRNIAPQAAPAPSPEPAASIPYPAAAESSPDKTEEVLELTEEETPTEETPEAEPEPDYVILNVMREVVEDKIIYFMRRFDVCTCDKCRADTIALTLSGLPAQYKVVKKTAVAPLVSYYASRLISQVTVEALKACTQVRENPRH